MSRRLRHHYAASRRLHDVLRLLATLLALVCLELSLGALNFGGLSWRDSIAASSTSSEAFGAPASSSQPIALTGPRSLMLVAGPGEGRQRTGQLVAAGDPSCLASAVTLHDGTVDMQLRPPLVLARGMLTVRAPPPAA